MAKKVNNVRTIIDKLGGASELSKRMSVGYKAVNNWQCWGIIPAHHYAFLTQEAKKAGFEISDDVWNFYRKPNSNGSHLKQKNIEARR